MVLIDLSKAFGSISHEILLFKLRNLGPSNQSLEWFKTFLTNRKQFTRLGTSRSEELTTTYGVPQGSILGPMLFGLYMKDLPFAVKFCSVEFYVDNTKIYLSFPSKDTNSKMKEDRHIAGWCCSNQLLINPSKTKLTLFGTRQRPSRVKDVTIPFLSQDLIPVSSVKDLGIIPDSMTMLMI